MQDSRLLSVTYNALKEIPFGKLPSISACFFS